MATNRKKGSITEPVKHLAVVCSHPTTPASGDPVRFGTLAGVAQQAERADGKTTVDFGPTTYDLSVKAVDANGDSAVAAGDAIYYVDADDPVLSKKATGTKIGTALAAVTAGATATIEVLVGR